MNISPSESTVSMHEGTLLSSAVKKLTEGNFGDLLSLPNSREEPLWGEIRSSFALSLAELSTLKNHACSPVHAVPRPRGVLPRIGGDGTIYRINDDRIRAKFTISNQVGPYEKIMEAELLVDSGASTELKLPARKIQQLGLRPRHDCRPVYSRGSTNHRRLTQLFSAVLVKATFIRDVVEEFVEADLVVKCDKEEYDNLPAIATDFGAQGDRFTTPTPQLSTSTQSGDFGPANRFERITKVHLSPFKHRPSDTPLEQAVIGMDGLKKLRLHLNCELQQLEIEEDEVLEDGEW